MTTKSDPNTYRWEPRPNGWFTASKPNQLTEDEWKMLARLMFEGGAHPNHPDEPKRPTEVHQVLLNSLVRFGYASYADLFLSESEWSYVGVLPGWMPTDEGRRYFDSRFRPSHGCGCEHAIRLGCVCAGKTYCPNPEHFGNGCHGSHD
jgi:hypothetical protein